MNNKLQKHNGFTLIELMIALSIIIAMSTIAYNKTSDYMQTAKRAAAKTGATTIAQALTRYRFEMDKWPNDLQELTKGNKTFGPWLSASDLKDPWNQHYSYSLQNKQICIWSNGPNNVNNHGQGDDRGFITLS